MHWRGCPQEAGAGGGRCYQQRRAEHIARLLERDLNDTNAECAVSAGKAASTNARIPGQDFAKGEEGT